MEKAIFLDKDGTITEYNTKRSDSTPEEILKDVLMEEKVLDGLKYLQEKGFKLIVISNQSWIGRGVVTAEQIEDLFKELVLKLDEKGVKIDDYFYCPHRKADGCGCRKPGHQLLIDAAKKHGVNLENSYMVGDSVYDIGAGKNAGTRTILVRTGKNTDFSDDFGADYFVDDINALRKII